MESIVGPGNGRGTYGQQEDLPPPTLSYIAEERRSVTAPPQPTLHDLLKEARYLERMVARVYDVTRPGSPDPSGRQPPGPPVVIGYRFKLPPGGAIKPKDGEATDRLREELTKKVRTATYASHQWIVNRMKVLVGQRSLTPQIVRDLGELHDQAEGIELLSTLTAYPGGRFVIPAAAADKGLEITFTEKHQATDLLTSFNGALAPYITAAMDDLKQQMTVLILRAERPAP